MPGASSTADAAPMTGREITGAGARAIAATLITPELIVFPVRHHSPACAWHVRRIFADRPPSVVLVEGPRSFSPLIPLLTHEAALMPLAIYTYTAFKGEAEDGCRRAGYYPFCDYSPELVALRQAQLLGIPSRFIDLDFGEQNAVERPVGDEVEAVSLLDEHRLGRSRYLTLLAEQLGCRNHEELWEHLFEVNASNVSLDEHISRVAAYCHLARSETPAEELAGDGTHAREQEMAWHIARALEKREDGSGPVLAVVGGFHAVALPALVRAGGRRPRVSVPAGAREESALIRYSYERLDRLNGYSSGMTSPAWHQLIWERTLLHDRAGHEPSPQRRREAALKLLFDIAEKLRKRHRIAVPMPAMTAAYEQLLRLAALRQRPAPARDDVLDAVTSCFVKGESDADGALVLEVARKLLGGVAMGRVPPGAGTPPLVKDFTMRARKQRLRIDEPEPRKAVLDIYRRPQHRVTSRLMHSMDYLGIPFAIYLSGPDFVNGAGLDRLQEHWEYSYSVSTEGALVEASMWGVTIPQAVANRFAARLERLKGEGRADARIAAGMLHQACLLGLHDHVSGVLDLLRTAVSTDASFESVARAAWSLSLLWESREPLEAREIEELPAMIGSVYERAVYLGGQMKGAQDDGGAIVDGLSRLRELLISQGGRALDSSLYWAMVSGLRTNHDVPLIRGAASGLLYAAGRLTEQELATALDGHFGGLSSSREAVAFLRGLLQTAREAAWQQPALLGVLDKLLREWDEEAFVASLPELRLAFAEMTPKETDRIAASVAALHGAGTLGPLVRYDLSEEELRARLELSATVRTVLGEDGLGSWLE